MKTTFNKNFRPGLLAGLGLLLLFASACTTSAAAQLGEAETGPTSTPTPFRPVTRLPATVTPTPTRRPLEATFPTPTKLAIPTIVALSPYGMVAGMNPLTGMAAASPELMDRRPMAVKISNYPRYVRPQSGLNEADVVFEYYIEGGLTRFIGIFYGQEAQAVGPVRSGRYFDEHIATMYHSFLVFKYADPRVYNDMQASPLRDFLVVPGAYTCPWFCQGKNKFDTYNNWYFNTIEWQKRAAEIGVDNSKQELRGGYFYSLAPLTDQIGQAIYTKYSQDDYNYWDYDSGRQKYVRYQETGRGSNYELLTDALNGLPVAFDNVVVIFVPHTFANNFDEEDEVYHIDLNGAGLAFLFRDGHAYPAFWHRAADDQPLLITDQSGALLPLKPGTTFFQVISDNSTYSEAYGEWHFEHKFSE
ncbi:MAG: DUF3048 domain-containing protein [Chloroflexota bacterium]